ncbi:MAG: phenylalanyl-tRNA synthetase beta chain, partial [Cryptosporangiaceae bacterium]|nr:phenylalanyl-tRNA synthetase beta chain [Cryptosporangiaceae bacterium]
MRVPVSWLREYTDLGDATTEQIDAALVRMGLEVEAVHQLGEGLSGPIVVGEVVTIRELTGFKKPIRHVLVDTGESEPRSIVCGAANFNTGDWIVASLPGAVLPGGFAIASRTTYGELSDGMICSARELGLGDDHTGILVLDRTTLPAGVQPGTDAIGLLELSDTVFELAITPDRGYCLSVRGIARELSHAFGTEFRDPGLAETHAVTAEPPHPVEIADRVGCDRFVARAVTGIDGARRSPLWMQRRLILAGMRPISLAVDITNYLMLELGQPMHAFDRATLTGPIVVRRGRAGERVRTLDGADRAVDPEDLLITDDTGPIGLAAVMGGATTEVTASTTDVLIECAHWDPVSVARSARRHKLPSEASKRFERGVDPRMAPVAAERAVKLLVELGGGVADPRV